MKKRFIYLFVLLTAVAGILIYHTSRQINQQPAANAASSTSSSTSKQLAIRTKRAKIKQRLQKYLNKVTADKTASVSFYNLSPVAGSQAAKSSTAAVYQEGKLAASANAHTAEVAASTFKLFITAFLMKEKQAGNFSWTTANQTGFENMIVYSQNDYADEQLSNYGLSTINSFIANQGWYSPVFVEGQDAETTATSLIYLLKQLAEGTGVFSNSSDRSYILGLMKNKSTVKAFQLEPLKR